MQVVKYISEKIIFPGAAAIMLLCGCSEEKAVPLPKTHPELLFEISECGKKNDYVSMLPKIQRLRAIDRTSVFLAELENTARVNILVDEVNRLAASGKFREALNVVNNYERKNGMSSGSDMVREYLSRLIQLDDTLSALQNPKNSAEFKKDLLRLKNLKKIWSFRKKSGTLLPPNSLNTKSSSSLNMEVYVSISGRKLWRTKRINRRKVQYLRLFSVL